MADAKATEIYAGAYNQSPESAAFYEFTRTMQAYKSIVEENSTLVLSTDSELLKYLKGTVPQPGAGTAGAGVPQVPERYDPASRWRPAECAPLGTLNAHRQEGTNQRLVLHRRGPGDRTPMISVIWISQ